MDQTDVRHNSFNLEHLLSAASKRKFDSIPKKGAKRVKQCDPLFNVEESSDILGTINALFLAVGSIEADIGRLQKMSRVRTDVPFRLKELDSMLDSLVLK